MRSLLLSAIVVASFIFCTSANAEFTKQDYLSTGDNLASKDQSTGLSWLSLSLTSGMSVQEVLSETEYGERFYGWRMPTGEEVETLLSNVYPTFKFNNNTQSEATIIVINDIKYADLWLNIVGMSFNGTVKYGYGLYTQAVGNSSVTAMTGLYWYWDTREPIGLGRLYEDFGSYSANERYDYFGVFLVRDNVLVEPPKQVDVPATFPVALLALGIMLMTGLRKCKKR